ncbi:polysaccharide deacetylase [Hydrogenimonas sp.]|nr:polysaccharide deacetylase [Hydrogenimonas sp.]
MGIKQFIKNGYLHIGNFLYENRSSKVIYYHDLHDKDSFTPMSTPVDLFKKHLDIIAMNDYDIVKSIDKNDLQLEITFDDGFRGLYENFSIFIDRNIPVKLFTVTSFIGKNGYLTDYELKNMYDTGLLSIGSHTHTHSDLEILTKDQIYDELKRSKEILGDMLNCEVDTLCYPRGRFNDTAVECAKDLGYSKQYTCLPGNYFEHFREGLINRSLVQAASDKEFQKILNGADKVFYKRYLKQHYHPES